MRYALVVIALVGCVRKTVYTTATSLAAQETQLVTTGSANVPAFDGGKVKVDADREILAWFPRNQIRRYITISSPHAPAGYKVLDVEPRVLSVRELVTGCAAGECLAEQAHDQNLIEIGSRRRANKGLVAQSVGAGVAVGVGFTCFFHCEGDATRALGMVPIGIAVFLLRKPLEYLLE